MIRRGKETQVNELWYKKRTDLCSSKNVFLSNFTVIFIVITKQLLIEEYKAYIEKMKKAFECISILDWIWIFCAWPSIMEKVKWEVGSLVWSEVVHSHTPSRVRGIKHCTEPQYPGLCTSPSCVQASTKPHKSELCASYQSPLIFSAPFEQDCRMTVIPPQSGPSAHAASAVGFFPQVCIMFLNLILIFWIADQFL